MLNGLFLGLIGAVLGGIPLAAVIALLYAGLTQLMTKLVCGFTPSYRDAYFANFIGLVVPLAAKIIVISMIINGSKGPAPLAVVITLDIISYVFYWLVVAGMLDNREKGQTVGAGDGVLICCIPIGIHFLIGAATGFMQTFGR
jgi:hypothetical protein